MMNNSIHLILEDAYQRAESQDNTDSELSGLNKNGLKSL